MPDFKCEKTSTLHNATHNVTTGQCYAENTCDSYYSQLAAFTITFGDVIYTLPPKNLLYDHLGACYFNMFYNEAFGDEILVGQPFVETFSMHFDYDNDLVSFAQNIKANPGASISRIDIPSSGSKGFTIEEFIGFACFGLLTLTVIVVGCFFCGKAARKSDREQVAAEIAYSNIDGSRE